MSSAITGTYASWVTWLEAFRAGEEPSTEGLPRVDGDLGAYVEARLLDRLSAVVTERILAWRAALTADLTARPPRDATAVGGLLRAADARLAPLARLAASPLLPRAVGAALAEALRDARASARAAVEDARVRAAEEAGAPVPPLPTAPVSRGWGGPVRRAPGRFPTVAEAAARSATATVAATPPGGLPVPRPRTGAREA